MHFFSISKYIPTLETHCPCPRASAYNILPLFGHIGRIFGQNLWMKILAKIYLKIFEYIRIYLNIFEYIRIFIRGIFTPTNIFGHSFVEDLQQRIYSDIHSSKKNTFVTHCWVRSSTILGGQTPILNKWVQTGTQNNHLG